jgi:hypothetical protein
MGEADPPYTKRNPVSVHPCTHALSIKGARESSTGRLAKLAYVRPTHGPGLLMSGQVPTGWHVKALDSGTTVTAYVSCAP